MASVSAPLLRRLRRYIVERVQAGCSEAARILPMLPAARKAPKKELPEHLRSTRPARQVVHRMTTAEIRAACMERSKGVCECGCGRLFSSFRVDLRPELDHWLGGSGRRREEQSIETCWMLVSECALRRTLNEPSAEHWNAVFGEHCQRHGYPVPTLHVVHAPIPAPQFLPDFPEVIRNDRKR